MPVLRWFLLVCVLTQLLRADDIALISVGENWRYLKGTSEPPTSNGLPWFQPGYDDAHGLRVALVSAIWVGTVKPHP